MDATLTILELNGTVMFCVYFLFWVVLSSTQLNPHAVLSMFICDQSEFTPFGIRVVILNSQTSFNIDHHWHKISMIPFLL